MPITRSLAIFGLFITPFILTGCQNTDTSPSAEEGLGLHPPISELDQLTPMNEPYVAMVRHSFSEVGRDFDPYITDDGMSILYASTSQSEKSDIFFKTLHILSFGELAFMI